MLNIVGALQSTSLARLDEVNEVHLLLAHVGGVGVGGDRVSSKNVVAIEGAAALVGPRPTIGTAPKHNTPYVCDLACPQRLHTLCLL